MMTMNGHLIFQTGTNHNITFRSTGGGYVNIDGENVQQLASLVRGGSGGWYPLYYRNATFIAN